VSTGLSGLANIVMLLTRVPEQLFGDKGRRILWELPDSNAVDCS
jgi:hypothetical protein